MEAPLTDAPQSEALQTEVLQAGTPQAEAPMPEAPQAEAPAPEPAPRAEPLVKVEQSYWEAEGLSARMRKARAITLYLMDPAVASLKAVDEAQLKDAGCEYSTEDAALIANFADSIERTSVRSNSFVLQFEPREAIYMALGGGSEMKLLFEKPYPNQTEVLGQINGQPVTVSKSLVEGLYRWAAKVDRVRRCENFVGKYR
ncbi:hypothetical protein [Ralstonia holmesii]|uniref:Uncharacterized protein n=1 Tax=Ralstonia holmesii TaxID=3058602 RepID=A0ABC8QAR4_9RALS|nr:hypothetical protein [Ralstonia sp. LMG 32967]CAJ0778099.1 hypothetical protein LMG18096_00749 [Ralstonia sp. LMG 32967]CAJ0810037.1 hypothetical protein LMG18093_00858 [Ralstonia sp. LMG 32967]